MYPVLLIINLETYLLSVRVGTVTYLLICANILFLWFSSCKKWLLYRVGSCQLLCCSSELYCICAYLQLSYLVYLGCPSLITIALLLNNTLIPDPNITFCSFIYMPKQVYFDAPHISRLQRPMAWVAFFKYCRRQVSNLTFGSWSILSLVHQPFHPKPHAFV